MATLHLRQRDTHVRLKAELEPARCEPCDYKMTFSIIDDDAQWHPVTLSRRQVIELRDWITKAEMYGDTR